MHACAKGSTAGICTLPTEPPMCTGRRVIDTVAPDGLTTPSLIQSLPENVQTGCRCRRYQCLYDPQRRSVGLAYTTTAVAHTRSSPVRLSQCSAACVRGKRLKKKPSVCPHPRLPSTAVIFRSVPCRTIMPFSASQAQKNISLWHNNAGMLRRSWAFARTK